MQNPLSTLKNNNVNNNNNNTNNNVNNRENETTKVTYYYPATRIRSLIYNLDEELKRLSKQCVTNKTELAFPSMSQPQSTNHFNNVNSLQVYSYYGKGRDLSPVNSPSPNVHLRTLSNVYRARVIEAYRNRRIFTVYGNYVTVRRALLRRGWLEKLAPGRYSKLQNITEDVLLQNAKRGNDYEAVLISRIINHFPSFFIWQGKGMRDQYADVHPYRNRVRRRGMLDFSTKIGLIGCAKHEHWFTQDGLCRMSYPRFYILRQNSEERSSFIEDFRNTQCRCLIRYVWENMQNTTVLIDLEKGTINTDILIFAMNNLRKQIKDFENVDNTDIVEEVGNDICLWDEFMSKSMEVIKHHAKFRAALHDIIETARQGRVLLNQIEEKRPDYIWDGCRNLWILKPGFSCRGIGIIIRSSLDEIVNFVTTNAARSYIAQKYIERPLLVYKTKFDIRQYMLLVIGESTVSIWLYKDCYLRFSSQEFTIDDLREAIHLTNNSVQKKYRSKYNRDPRLPRSNMWSLSQFQTYLKLNNVPEEIWKQRVFKGFKENLVAVVMASLEETDLVQNAFELYGCDFMLDESYKPILIEINSTPDLSPSTEITAHICPTVLKDVIKVVVDRPANNDADVGQFEMAYEVNYKIKEVDPEMDLSVTGRTVTMFKQSTRFIKRLPAFFKKPFKSRKSAENKKNFIIGAVKVEEDGSSPKSSPKSNSTSKLVRPQATKPERKIVTRPVKLKPLTKEALALRYTLPK